MARVEWESLLANEMSSTIRVDYSYLSVPEERDELDRDVARIRLSNGHLVDIAWDEEQEEYIVTLSLHFYEQKIVQHRQKDVMEVLEVVKGWASQCARDGSLKVVT